MAIYNGGILDEYRNKVGNVVGRRWRNLDVMSKYQPNVKNPNTDKQKIQRMKFAELSRVAKAFRIPLATSMAGVAAGTKNPVRGQFITRNMSAVEVTLPNTVDVDFTQLDVAAGGYFEASFGSPNFDNPLAVEVSFSYDVIPNVTSGDDMVHLVVYNPGDNLALEASAKASARSIELTVPNSWNGETVHVWGYTVAAEAGNRPTSPAQVSPSHYIGNGSIS
jgi:hypothetical protein